MEQPAAVSSKRNAFPKGGKFSYFTQENTLDGFTGPVWRLERAVGTKKVRVPRHEAKGQREENGDNRHRAREGATAP